MMGIYQIRSMDRVPVSAAVNESVKLAKRYGHGASAGFVNGVLRAAAKGEKDVFPDGKEGLCIRYSYPSWLADMFIRDLGYEETEKLFRAMNKYSISPDASKVCLMSTVFPIRLRPITNVIRLISL